MKSKGLQKDEVSGQFPESGAIFMTSCTTLEECLERKIFALSRSYADFVREVKPGMILFLFEYEKRELYGVFRATSNGEIDIVSHAFTSSGRQFPAQVRFTTIWNCHPLCENEFREPIKENYFTRNKFNLGLSRDQVNGLLSLFHCRKVEDANFQKLTCDKKRHVKKRCHKFLIEDEEMEKQSPRSRRKLSSGNLDVGGSVCSMLGYESAISNFGWGSQSSMYREEPEYLHSSEYLRTGLGNSIPLSLPGHVSYYNEPILCRGEPENLKHSYEHLRSDLGDLIPASFTVNEPSIYREEPQNLIHSSEDLRTNLGDYIPMSLTFNQPRICGEGPENLLHSSEDLRTNFGNYLPSSFPNTVSDYNGDNSGVSVVKRTGVFARLGKVSESVRQDNSVFSRLQWVNGKQNKKTRKSKPTVLAKNGDCIVDNSVETWLDILQENNHRKTLIREPVVSIRKHEYEGHFKKGIQMGEMPKGRDPTEERDCRDGSKTMRREPVVSVRKHECEEHFKKGIQMEMPKRRDPTEERDCRDGSKTMRKEPVVSIRKREFEEYFKKGVEMGEMLNRRDPTDKRDCTDGSKTLIREPVVSIREREYEENFEKGVEMGEMLKRRDRTVERNCKIGPKSNDSKTFIREPVVSIRKSEYEENFKKGVQMGEMLKRRDPTVERNCKIGPKSNGSKTLIREPVVSIRKRECEEHFKKGVQMGEMLKRRDPTEERDCRDGSKSNGTFEHRPRRKLIRPSFYNSTEVQTFGPTGCVNKQNSEESSAGKENDGNCEESSKTNRTDCEKEVPPATCPSHCKDDNLTDHEPKLVEDFGDRFNSGVETLTKALKTYKRRPKRS